VRGFPIRTSSDQRSVGSSPRLLAASHVLHRLLVPRHPPCALTNLATQKPTNQPPTTTPRRHRHPRRRLPRHRGGTVKRCSRPLCSSQPPTREPPRLTPPARGHPRRSEIGTAPDKTTTPTGPAQPGRRGPFPQDPTARLRPPPPTRPVPRPTRRRSSTGGRRQPAAELVSVPPASTTPATRGPSPSDGPSRAGRGSAPDPDGTRPALLRKEVIQPHLPVRLPCYDFVPIADPAFDGSLPRRGWATGFGRYRLS
jgi:hypothetical protein